MLKHNDINIVGIDHGFGNLKTANIVVPSGVKVYDLEPPLSSGLITFNGKYIAVGGNHKAFNADKTEDDDNYYLTLYGIAREFSLAGITEGDVYLAVGLPLMWVSLQRESFSKYLTRNENVEFDFNGRHYKIHIVGVKVFPQSYCAVYDKLREMDGFSMIADIGNGTINIMKVNDRKVINESCRTERLGVGRYVTDIQNAVMNKFQNSIDESIVTNYLIGKSVTITKEYEELMRICIDEYIREVISVFRKYDYNPDLMKLYVVGGGAVVMKRFSQLTDNVTYITDVCANAKGYEYMIKNFLRKNGV